MNGGIGRRWVPLTIGLGQHKKTYIFKVQILDSLTVIKIKIGGIIMRVEIEKIIQDYLQASINCNVREERVEIQRAILHDFFNYVEGADYEVIANDKRK